MDVIGFLCVSLGSSTFQLYDSVGSRRACPCLEAGFSSQIGDRALYTTEEQRSVAHFCGQKDSIQIIFVKNFFLFTVGSVCHVKRFIIRSRNSLKDVQKSQMMPDQVRKWQRQQPKDFYAVGFDALVKQQDKCSNVGGGYVEKFFFFQVPISHILRFISICDVFTDSPSYLSQVRQTVSIWI
jgi:hypothetical protein